EIIARDGWPDDLTSLPGVGVYTAGAVAAQADGADTVALDVNVRRVVQRVRGAVLPLRAAETAAIAIAAPLRDRDRLLALLGRGGPRPRPRRWPGGRAEGGGGAGLPPGAPPGRAPPAARAGGGGGPGGGRGAPAGAGLGGFGAPGAGGGLRSPRARPRRDRGS